MKHKKRQRQKFFFFYMFQYIITELGFIFNKYADASDDDDDIKTDINIYLIEIVSVKHAKKIFFC